MWILPRNVVFTSFLDPTRTERYLSTTLIYDSHLRCFFSTLFSPWALARVRALSLSLTFPEN